MTKKLAGQNLPGVAPVSDGAWLDDEVAPRSRASAPVEHDNGSFYALPAAAAAVLPSGAPGTVPRPDGGSPGGNAPPPIADGAASPAAKEWSPSSAEGPHSAIAPSDPLYGNQWHLKGANGINVAAAWNDYAGRGVLVGVVDDGVHYTHRDLDGNYRTDLDYDARNKDNDAFSSAGGDKHGTAVAGTIAAEWGNSYGGVGVAWDADLVGFRMGFGANGSNAQILDLMQRQDDVHVSNNSWGFGGFFYDNFNSAAFSAIGKAVEDAAHFGRGGLGTVVVFAAGNERASGQNVNYHDFQNSPYVIAVAATDVNGVVASFSTPGAAVLVAAPGVGIVTIDRPGMAGYVSGDFVSVSGTSFSAPIVSGVVALMLEANPFLGYRDVQEILVYSARGTYANDRTNGADNWNGGGLTVNHDYGFGLVDAFAAVRLAETWDAQSTFANMQSQTVGAAPSLVIADNATLTSSLAVAGSTLSIDRVEIGLNITHTWIGDLVVTLTSPDGTTSVLVNRPGMSASAPAGTSQDNISFIMDSVQFWGESPNGTWQLAVSDMAGGDTGRLNSWSLTFLGDADTANDTYIYTNLFGSFASDGSLVRETLIDTGGTDTINLSAVSTGVTLYLTAGMASSIAGNTLHIAAGTLIENAYLGDGNDSVFGNDAANLIWGGRGADTLAGGAGDDVFAYARMADSGDRILDFSGANAAGGDVLSLHDLLADVGYDAGDPLAAFLSQQVVNADSGATANDIAVRVDADGAGVGGFVTVATVMNVGTSVLTVGTANSDILV